MTSRVESDANYFASMTDMTIGVLFILIIMIAYFAHQNQSQNPIQIYIDRGEQERKGIARTVAQGLRERNIDAIVSPKNPGVVTLRGANLFVKGESELTPVAKETISFLAQVIKRETACYVLFPDAPVLHGECNSSKVFIEAIFIEGHTDDRPVAATLRDGSKNNLELSARRATNTHDIMIRAESQLAEFRNLDKEPVLSVAAYGEQRPISPNIDETARDRNRRIDIRFVMWIPKSIESYNNQIRRIEELRLNAK
jgi:chemotaxis protein MotB